MPILRDILESIFKYRTATPELDFWNQITPVVPPFARTEPEENAGVTPTDYSYLPGDSRRYSTLQEWINSYGTTASMHGGDYYLSGGSHEITATLLINRKSGVFHGDGPGSAQNGTGSVITWSGAAGSPMLSIEQSLGLTMRDMRFRGNSAAKPSSAIYIDTSNSAPSPSALNFDGIWIGSFGSFDSDNAVQFTDGFVVDGAANLQGDQSEIAHITVQSVTTSCIAFRNTQATLWFIHTATLNFAQYGLEIGTRHITATNVFCQTLSLADYYMPVDGSATIDGFGSELGGRLCYAIDGFDFIFRRGYFQAATASVIASGRIIDLTSSGAGSIIMEGVLLYAQGGYAGPALKFYVRGTKVLIKLVDVTLPTTIDAFFDIATVNSGDSRHLILENVTDSTGDVFNGNFYWVHGAYAPTLSLEALGQQDKIVVNGSSAWNIPSTLNNGVEAIHVTVPGARRGDYALASVDTLPTNWELDVQVVAADDAYVRATNKTGVTDDPGAGTVRVRVIKF